MKPLKILAVTLHPSAKFTGGSGRIANAHFAILRERGHIVREISFSKLGQACESLDGKVYRPILGGGTFIARAILVNRLLRNGGEHDIAAIHYHPYLASACFVDLGIPIIVHFHGPWADEEEVAGAPRLKVYLARVLERRILSRASDIVCLSEEFKAVAAAKVVDRDQIRFHVIPGSTSDYGEMVPLQPQRRVVLVVRRLVERTGVAPFVEALDARRLRELDVTVEIVGEGPQYPRIKEAIRKGGLEGLVSMCGTVSDERLRALYAASMISVLPTLALEGFGMAALESLAMGTPAMSTPVGGLATFLRGLSPSLVSASSDPGSFVQHLYRSIEERTLPSREECLSFARRFSTETIKRPLIQIYETSVHLR